MSHRILYVSTIFPYPAHRGGKLRISNVIRRLSERHEVHLVSLCAEHKSEMEALRTKAEETATSVHLIPHDRQRWRGGVRSVLMQEPYEVGLHHNRRMEKAVAEKIADLSPDLLWCSRLASLQYLPDEVDATVLLDQHDLASRLWKIMGDRVSTWWVQLFARYNRVLVERYEKRVYKNIDICVSVSEEEKRLTGEFAPHDLSRLTAPNGVDVGYFSPSGEEPDEPGMLVSVGSMDQVRNVDASRFFVDEVLPLLRERGLEVRYYIVGQNPTKEVRAMGNDPAVTVTGTVDDVRPFLERSTVVVAPYRMGSGVKHKIPISFSMGKPVVATPNACQGLDVTDGREVMIAEGPEAFADAVQNLLDSKAKRDEMARRAQTFVRREYSWDVIVGRLIDQVETLINDTGASSELQVDREWG